MNKLTVFEGTPFSTKSLSASAKAELENMQSQTVFLHAARECQDERDKYVFSSVQGGRLAAWRHVGVVQTSDGSVIEILPKVFRDNNGDCDTTDEQNACNLLLQMLERAGIITYRKAPSALLSDGTFSLLDVFLHLFVSEMQEVLRKGLKKDYVAVEDNLLTLKGRIHFPQHIRRNAVAQYRLFCRFDEYSTNNIENQLLATALVKVARVSNAVQTRKLAAQLLAVMGGVDGEIEKLSCPTEDDFARCRTGRFMAYYRAALTLARLILLAPPIPNVGKNDTLALLFDMAALFEKTVEKSIPKLLGVKDFGAQKPLGWFKGLGSPKPDFCFSVDEKKVVADAKWKLPPNGVPNKADQYQLFTYMQLLGVEEAWLVYPKHGLCGLQETKCFTMGEERPNKVGVGEVDICLRCVPFDLETFKM